MDVAKLAQRATTRTNGSAVSWPAKKKKDIAESSSNQKSERARARSVRCSQFDECMSPVYCLTCKLIPTYLRPTQLTEALPIMDMKGDTDGLLLVQDS
jgi:hypothetical protein